MLPSFSEKFIKYGLCIVVIAISISAAASKSIIIKKGQPLLW